MLAIDQYGYKHRIPGVHPRKELLALFDRKHAAKMYQDKKDGRVVHTGYIIATLWLTLFIPFEKEA